MTVREQALHQRIRTGMHVTDDRLILAPRDRGDIVRRHLHVDRLKHAGTPARPVIREGHGGAITDGPRVRIGEHAREPVVELLGLVADLWRELHQRPHHLAEDGGERAPVTGRHAALDHSFADRVDLPAVPPPRLEEHAQRRRHIRDEARAEREVNVAQAIDIGKGPGAVGPARMTHRCLPGELDERPVECAQRVCEQLGGGVGNHVAGMLEAIEGRQTGGTHERVAMRPQRSPQLVLGAWTGRDPELRIERRGEGLHRPCLEVDGALARQRTRAHRDRRSVISKPPPGERPEETDRVVLGAIALPVAGNDLLAPASPAELDRGAVGHLRDGVDHRRGVLPRDGFPEERVAGDAAEASRLVAAAKRLKPGDRKAGTAQGNVAPQRPAVTERDVVLGNRVGLSGARAADWRMTRES